MEKIISLPDENTFKTSTIMRMCGNAFNLIREGKEVQARNDFPMEYHVIKKYLPSSFEELTSVLRTKLQVF